MTTPSSEILDDLFHACAFRAYVDEAAATGGQPCRERTKYRAYRYYEADLAAKNAACPRASSNAPVTASSTTATQVRELAF
ncbi:MAG: hypothetical protein R3C59_09590 [Planctomycetaceae bacterium]